MHPPGGGKKLEDSDTAKLADDSPFTVDTPPGSEESVGAEVPTITALLNRRKCSSTKSSPRNYFQTNTPALEETPKDSGARSQVKKIVKRLISSSQRRLVIWTRPELAQSEDLVCRALHLLCKTGKVQQAVLLNLLEKSNYRVTHGLEAGDRSALWTGLNFHPSVAPEIWQMLLSEGIVEAPGENELPPERQTLAQASALRFVRNLFGLEPEERLVLFRQGSSTRCQGILAVISADKLGPVIESAREVLREATGQFSRPVRRTLESTRSVRIRRIG